MKAITSAAIANADVQARAATELGLDQDDAAALAVKVTGLKTDLDAYLLALDTAAKSKTAFQYACWKMAKDACAEAVKSRIRLRGLNRIQWSAALAVPAP